VTTLLLILVGGARLDETIDPIVTTRQGNMRGITMTSRNGRTFYAFLGIPYAAPPVGALRFKVSLLERTSHLIVGYSSADETTILEWFLVNCVGKLTPESIVVAITAAVTVKNILLHTVLTCSVLLWQ
jgi:hypothetical protein